MLNPQTAFLNRFESELRQLKARYCEPVTPEWKAAQHSFRSWVKQHLPDTVQATQLSSLYAVPTRRLSAQEKVLHRVWLGGPPPQAVSMTVQQWQNAIHASGSDFQQTLWVWDAAQLAAEARFVAQAGTDPLQIGALFYDRALMRVNSLSALLQQLDAPLSAFLRQLHQQRYYATLSDFFRLAILVQYGGVYLDADTLPAQPASLFLSHPELPDYLNASGEAVSWMNLFVDETGMIIAHQGDAALTALLAQLSTIYRRWPQPLAAKDATSERAIFEPFYQLWCQQLQRSQLSHQDFCQHFAVYGFDQPEARISGIRGMRLQEDILSGKHCPLSSAEQCCYLATVEQLSARDWQLTDPLLLSELTPVFTEHAVLQIAYAPQLRAEIPGYHYYGVLSRDRNLDRANQLFSDYLIALNQQQIDAGDFWVTVNKPQRQPLWYLPGHLTTLQQQRKMAELIFSTSYLQYCSVDNQPQLPLIDLQLKQNIQPYLPLITALFDAQGNMVGFVSAGTELDYSAIAADYLYRASMRPLDDAYDEFVGQHSKSDDLFIGSVALTPAAQGKGYFSVVLENLLQQAQARCLRRITLCVWQSSPAVEIYCRKGFKEIAVMQREVARFHDPLLFMALNIR